ncbi:MAG: VWA domain-containing protein [Saprospiraceae bacterium]
MKWIIFYLASFIFVSPVFTQNNENRSPIIFIYDASGSMWGKILTRTKMEIARDVLTTAINNLPDNQKIGLVAYGHRQEGDCRDVEILVDVSNGTKTAATQAVKTIKPLGRTPLAYSATQVINLLRQNKSNATIILITDGIESCDGDLCGVIKAAKIEGIIFKLHIIGFGLKNEDIRPLKCAAEAGDGKYFNADDADGLSGVLDESTRNTIDDPKANFSVYAVKNGKAVDAWVKAIDPLGKTKPIMVRTYKDTAYFYLPPSIYNFDIAPLEGSDVDKITLENVKSYKDKIEHRTFSFDAGKIKVTTTNNGENWDCVVKLFTLDNKVAASVRTYNSSKEVEVNPGTYKVTIQALGMEGMDTYTELKNITIQSGGVTPVSHDFKTGHFEIFTRVANENIDAVVTIHDMSSGKNVAGSRTYTKGSKFLLNPGAYTVKVTPLGLHKNKKTQNISIEVKKGEVVTKELKF